jgi:hypothetical protein
MLLLLMEQSFNVGKSCFQLTDLVQQATTGQGWTNCRHHLANTEKTMSEE